MAGQDRLVWVDVAKGLAIVLVVFGHVWRGLNEAGILAGSPLFEPVDRAIYLFHMPLFFFLSGLFVGKALTSSELIGRQARRVETYLYPLLLWSWITGIARVLAGDSANREPPTWLDALLYPFPPKDIFWFLWALFLIQAVCSAALMLPRRWIRPLAICALIASCGYVASGVEWPLVHNAIVHLPYFLVGAAGANLARTHIVTAPQAALGFSMFVLAECVALFSPARLAGLGALAGGLVAVLGLCVAIAWLVSAARHNGAIALVAWLGTTTMAVYVSHVLVLAAIRIALNKLGVEDPAIHVGLGTLLATALPVLLAVVASRIGINRVLGLGPAVALPRAARS